MDHEKLKSQLITEGEALGLKGKDIRVLSTDPYFVGSPDDYQDAKWAASLWDKMMAARRKPLHLRGFHYWIQSQGIFKPKSSLSKKDIQAGKSLEKYAQGADPAEMMKRALRSAPIGLTSAKTNGSISVTTINLTDGTSSSKRISPQDFIDGKALD